MGRPRKVIEGAEIEIDIPSLKEYVSQCEAKAQPLTLVEVTHPECKDGDIYAGVYSGIRMINGDTPSAKLSSGEMI